MASIAIEEIKPFMAAWYQALDIHAPLEDCCRFLADADFEMVVPDRTLRGLGDFRTWYVGGEYPDGTKMPGVVNIYFDETHVLQGIDANISGEEAVIDFVLGWQASWWEPPAAKSKRTALDATQRWKIRRSSKNQYGLEILFYNAILKPFQYAPGSARL
jgi:hypothetical protein